MSIQDKIIHVPLKDINKGERFREDYGDLDSLAESIAEKGVMQPISIDQDHKLLFGGRRLAACERLDLDTIPCIIREVEDELDYREIELYENIHRKDLTWVERAKLDNEIVELKAATKNWSQQETSEFLDQSVGLTNRHVQLARAIEVVPELAECKTENEAWKKLKGMEEAVVRKELQKRSKVQLSPKARVIEESYIVGNALELMPTVDEGSFAFAEVDPPYGIALNDVKRTESEENLLAEYKEVEYEDYGAFILEAASNVYRLLKPNTFCIWWYGPTHHILVKKSLLDAGFLVDDIPGIWVKGPVPVGQSQQPQTNLGNAYEPFFICRKGKPVLAKPGSVNVLIESPVHGPDKIHPTERPVALMQRVLDIFCPEGVSIVSPFLGSGNTIIAAHSRNTKCVGWDLSELHYAKALQRASETK